MILSIVIPAYNEEKRILKTLKDYYRFFKNQQIEFEILVEMDGCSDRTEEIVREFSKDKREVKFLSFKNKLGKGGGLLKGIEVCKGKYIGFVDADDSIKAKEFYKLFKACREKKAVHGVIASRNINSYFSKRKKTHRAFFSSVFNLFIRVLFGLKYKDTQCGGKIFKREAIFEVLKDVKQFEESKGFLFDVVLLYTMKKRGFCVVEYPINWIDKKGSKVSPMKVALDMFIQAVKFRVRLWLSF